MQRTTGLILSMVLSLSAVSQAVTLWAEDFESYPLNQPLAGWSYQWGDSGNSYVRTVSSPVSSGTRALRAKGRGGWCQGIYKSSVYFEGDQTLQFDVYVPSGCSAGQAPSYIIYAGMSLVAFATGPNTYDFNYGGQPVLTGFQTDRWYTFQADIRWNDQQFQLRQNTSASPWTDFSLNTSRNWGSAMSFYGNNSSATNTAYYDNVSLATLEADIPEPATLLAGLAGLAGVGRYLRQRK